MQREYYRWWSKHLSRDIDLLCFGHAGTKVLVFPTSRGRFFEYENNGMVAAVADRIDSGQLQLYCVDSVDGEPDGRITAINITTGGFLGFGTWVVAIPGDKFQRKGAIVHVDFTADEVAKLPAVKKASPLPPTALSGGWRIQLGAFAQRGSAEGLYQRVSGKAALAGRIPFYIATGPVTRLQVGPFQSKAAAGAVCGAIGVPCFPVPAK